MKACRNKAHFMDESGVHRFDVGKCAGCLACVNVCPSNAIEATSRLMSVDEIMKAVLADKVFYGTQGGITLSGGEPLLHIDACIGLLESARRNDISTAIETSGYFDDSCIGHIAPLTDWFLWDFKDGDAARHLKYTGCSNEKILHNLFLTDRYETKIILRCIMVKGVNMDAASFRAIAQTASLLKHCAGVELLPYHTYGGSKNVQLGFADNSVKNWIPTRQDIRDAADCLRKLGVNLLNEQVLR